MIKDLIKVQDKVRHLLEQYPVTRDNDKELWLAYNCVFNGLKEATISYAHFRMWLMRNETPVFESLSRARRKVQEEHPELVGEQYVKRKLEAEEVREWSKQ